MTMIFARTQRPTVEFWGAAASARAREGWIQALEKIQNNRVYGCAALIGMCRMPLVYFSLRRWGCAEQD
jgi:hypothetical protein